MFRIQEASIIRYVCGNDRYIAAELKSQEFCRCLQGPDTQWRLEPINSMRHQTTNVHIVNEGACGKYDKRGSADTRN